MNRSFFSLIHEIASADCYHTRGHGGAKAAVRAAAKAAAEPDCHVMKSDVLGYYANIDHFALYDIIEKYVGEPAVLRLLWQYMNRTVCFGENYREVTRGISLGCPLSPLMAALYLKPLDDAMADMNVFYVRFMDDWVVIAKTRWKLRKAVARVNKVLNFLKALQHPDKTFIGRADRGFDFLGFHIAPCRSVVPARKTLAGFVERIARLYEQDADLVRIREYAKRWAAWVKGGCLSFLNCCYGCLNLLEFYILLRQ